VVKLKKEKNCHSKKIQKNSKKFRRNQFKKKVKKSQKKIKKKVKKKWVKNRHRPMAALNSIDHKY
jgi:hypothetical protein